MEESTILFNHGKLEIARKIVNDLSNLFANFEEFEHVKKELDSAWYAINRAEGIIEKLVEI